MPKTRAQIAAEIATNLPDNTSGDITPTLLRDTLTDITAAAPNIADDAALLSSTLAKTADYTLLTTDNGKLVTLGNGQFTLILGDIATYPTTFTVLLFHQGNSRITIQAFGPQTIVNAEFGAENTKLMNQGESGFLTKIGTVWGFTKTNLTTLGDGLTSDVFNGTNRISVIPATIDELGGLIVGKGLQVDEDGVVSEQNVNPPSDSNSDIDISSMVNYLNVTANTTVTFSAAIDIGLLFACIFENSTVTDYIITLPGSPASISQQLGATRTTFTVKAGTRCRVFWYSQTTLSLIMIGEPVLITDLSGGTTITPSADLIVIGQSGSSVKKTLNALLAGWSRVIAKFSAIGITDLTHAAWLNLSWSNPSVVDADSADLGIDILPGSGPTLVLRGETPSNAPNFVYVPANRVRTATTSFLNVVTFSNVAAAGDVVNFRFVGEISADATGGAKFRIGFSGGAATTFSAHLLATNNANAEGITSALTNSEGATLSIAAGATEMHIVIEGLFIADDAGDLTIDFGQVVATGTSTLLKGARGRAALAFF